MAIICFHKYKQIKNIFHSNQYEKNLYVVKYLIYTLYKPPVDVYFIKHNIHVYKDLYTQLPAY